MPLDVYKVRYGGILNVMHGYTPEEKKRAIAKFEKQARISGKEIEFPDGSKVWFERDAIVDTTKTGSEQYTWDETGNKVLCKLWRVFLPAPGEGCKNLELLDECFVDFDLLCYY
jgi:hypothetical protein